MTSPIRKTRVPDLRSLLTPRRAIRHFLRLAIGMTSASSGSFILLNPTTGLLDIEASYGIAVRARGVKLKPGQGITGWVATTGQAMRIDDVRKERRYVSINPRIRSEIAVPVERDGRILGIINLDSTRLAHFTPAHQATLDGLAAEAAEWLGHGWELLNLRVRDQQLQTLVQMGRSIVSHTNLDDALSGIVRNGARLMKADVCSLMLLAPGREELLLRAAHGAGPRYQNRAPLKVGESLVGVVVRRQKPISVLNVRTDPRYHETEMAHREDLMSLLSVPLVFGARAIGVLNVYMRRPHRFSNEEIRLLQTLADLSAVAIEKGRLLARVVDTEEALRQSERLSALGLLAAEVAHEIRNPLTVMQMLFHSLVASTPMGAAARKDAAIIEEKMRQMNRIVDQILSLVRSAEPIKERVDVFQLIDDIILLVRHKLRRQGIGIRRAVAEDLPPVHADRAQLEQAILNLVLNAVGAMPDGGVLWLGAGLEKSADAAHVVLHVRDNGVGMTKAQADGLFAPFLTTKPKGTGIGLALVRRILENHRGRIEVESRRKKGTKVRLFLPVAEDFAFDAQGKGLDGERGGF